MTNKDDGGNQGMRSADDNAPHSSQRKADISAEIYRLKQLYSSLAFNDPQKIALKTRLNALRAEFASMASNRPSRPSDAALQAQYDSSDLVPVDVRNWVKEYCRHGT